MIARNRRSTGHNSVTNPLHFAAIALAAVMALITVTGCTPENVHQIASELGVTLTNEQATVIATDQATKPHVILAVAKTDPAALTEDQLKAIAWTALVVEQQKAAPPSYADMIRLRWAGTNEGERAVKVSMCESGDGETESSIDPGAQNPDSTAFGTFQFLNATWGSTTFQKTSDAWSQIQAAYQVWKARGWQPWKASRGCWAR